MCFFLMHIKIAMNIINMGVWISETGFGLKGFG